MILLFWQVSAQKEKVDLNAKLCMVNMAYYTPGCKVKTLQTPSQRLDMVPIGKCEKPETEAYMPPDKVDDLYEKLPGRLQEFDKVEIEDHPDEDYNGDYYYKGKKWNGQPHFESAKDKHLYYYDENDGGQYGWNLDNRDQSKMKVPGAKDWNDGGYFDCESPKECGNLFKFFDQDGDKKKTLEGHEDCKEVKCKVKFKLINTKVGKHGEGKYR